MHYYVICNPAYSAAGRRHGERETSYGVTQLYLDAGSAPRSKADCQRYANQPVARIKYDANGSVDNFSTWDGESYLDRHFCTDRCAAAQGRASADHGARFTWTTQA